MRMLIYKDNCGNKTNRKDLTYHPRCLGELCERGETMKHTEGKWKTVERGSPIRPVIVNEKNVVIAEAFGDTWEEAGKTAEFIVKACNNHADLLGASKHALGDLEYCKSNHKNDEQDSQILQATINQLEQAISKAENNK